MLCACKALVPTCAYKRMSVNALLCTWQSEGIASQGAARLFVRLHRLLAAPGLFSRGRSGWPCGSPIPAPYGTGFARFLFGAGASPRRPRHPLYYVADDYFICAPSARKSIRLYIMANIFQKSLLRDTHGNRKLMILKRPEYRKTDSSMQG